MIRALALHTRKLKNSFLQEQGIDVGDKGQQVRELQVSLGRK
jgi:hypothetical protein